MDPKKGELELQEENESASWELEGEDNGEMLRRASDGKMNRAKRMVRSVI